VHQILNQIVQVTLRHLDFAKQLTLTCSLQIVALALQVMSQACMHGGELKGESDQGDVCQDNNCES